MAIVIGCKTALNKEEIDFVTDGKDLCETPVHNGRVAGVRVLLDSTFHKQNTKNPLY